MEIENSSENYQSPVAEMIDETVVEIQDVKAEEANNARITDMDFTTGSAEGALVPVAVTRDVTHTVENSEFENESGTNDAESDAYSPSSEEGSKTEEEELSPILCSKVKKQIAEKAAANKFSYDLMQKDLMNLKNDIAKIQEDIPRNLASQRKEFLKHGFPIKMIPSFDPTENDFVLRYGASNALAPGDLVFSSKSISHLPIPFVKVIPEDSLFETNVQLLNVERNVLPKSLCCLGCYALIEKTETCLWCGDCGIPYCTESCSAHLTFCEKFSKVKQNLPNKNIEKLDFLTFDVAVAKLFELYDHLNLIQVMEDLITNKRTSNFMEKSTEYAHWKQKMNPENMPLSFAFAPVDKDEEKALFIQKVFAMICVFGFSSNYFDSKSKKCECYIFPHVQKFAHSCVSNTQVVLDVDESTIKIYAAKEINQNDLITIDLMNKPMWPTSARQNLLVSHYEMKCDCERCKDPTELGTYFSNYAACKCPDIQILHPTGYLVPELDHFARNSNKLSCTNRVQFGCQFEASMHQHMEYEELIRKSIQAIQVAFAKNGEMLYKSLKIVYNAVLEEGHLHENYFLMQYIRSLMLSWTLKKRFNSPSITPEDQKFSIELYNQQAWLLKKFLAQSSNTLGYTSFDKTGKELHYLEYLVAENVKNLSEAMQFLMKKLMPEYMHYWILLKLYRNPTDAQLEKNLEEFLLTFNFKGFLIKFKRVLKNELEEETKKLMQIARLEQRKSLVTRPRRETPKKRVNKLMLALKEKERQDEENTSSQEGYESFEPEQSVNESEDVIPDTDLTEITPANLEPGSENIYQSIPVVRSNRRDRYEMQNQNALALTASPGTNVQSVARPVPRVFLNSFALTPRPFPSMFPSRLIPSVSRPSLQQFPPVHIQHILSSLALQTAVLNSIFQRHMPGFQQNFAFYPVPHQLPSHHLQLGRGTSNNGHSHGHHGYLRRVLPCFWHHR